MHPLFAPAKAVLQALAPHPLYAVGGAVRRVVLGQDLAGVELDLCTPLLPEETLRLAQNAGLTVQTQGAKWGCITLNGIETTSFRAEVYVQGSRHPKVQFGVGLERDAMRRDFTCNAVYLAPDGTLIDPYNGAAHLKQGHVVWVEDPLRKLAEDPIRWWRWLRFCSTYGTSSVLAPSWAEQGGTEHAIDLIELAKVALAYKTSVSSQRWQAEAIGIAHGKHADAVRTSLRQGLASLGPEGQELIP